MSEGGSKVGCTVLFNLGIGLAFLVLVLNWFNPNILSLNKLNNFFESLQPESTRQMWEQPKISINPSTNLPQYVLLLNAKTTQSQIDTYLDKVQQDEADLPIMLSLIDMEQNQVLWDKTYKESNRTDLSHASSLFQDELAFLWLKKKLQAIEAQDGQIIWETNLQGQKDSDCHNCFAIREKQLFILDNQSVLTSLSAVNGNVFWKVKLRKYNPFFGLHLVGKEVAILDNRSVNFYQMNSGDLTKSIQPKSPGNLKAAFFDKFKERILFIIQSGNQIQMELWQVKLNQRLWQITLPNNQFIPNYATYQFFFTDRHLLFPVEQGSEKILMKITLRTGQFKPFLQSSEYDFRALVRVRNDILLQAKYLKGSEDNQLWLVNGNNSQIIWKHTLDAKKLFLQPEFPQDVFPEQWTFQIQKNEIKTIQVLENPQRLMYKTIGITDGKAIFERTTNINDIFWSGTTWMENKAYLNFQNLYELDFENGKLNKVFP